MGALRSNEAEVAASEQDGPWKRVQLQRGSLQKLKQGVQRAREYHALINKITHQREVKVVMEIFAGCAMLSRVSMDRPGWQSTEPIDLLYGYDLPNPVTQKEILAEVREVQPDLITLSPRCGPWSQFQRLNPNIDKVMDDRKEDIPLWRFCRVLWDEQTREGRLALTENPWQSEALLACVIE